MSGIESQIKAERITKYEWQRQSEEAVDRLYEELVEGGNEIDSLMIITVCDGQLNMSCKDLTPQKLINTICTLFDQMLPYDARVYLCHRLMEMMGEGPTEVKGEEVIQ